jgi:hypothetical protein
MKKYNEGDYFGRVGDYTGIVYLNGKWVKYECGPCMRAHGLLGRRLNNGDNPKLNAMFNSRKFEYRHNPVLHNEWLAAGKTSRRN